ncbi:ISNCY family transposase [Calothrix sp. PCC 6303]|uniref:ISNCY family transposase n=2 Tax=Calothrix sp. PCC 6303 TaxID=1170562 RepID=UPI0002A00E90|nr:hypothetical protein Cal6303_0025 [Calothrix sp. PCC 6303]
MIEILGFADLLGYLQAAVGKMEDPRKDSPNKQYSIKDAVLSAFGAFFMQCESFLEYQRQLNSRKGRDNTQTLFKVSKIPTDNQIRNIIDPIKVVTLFEVFEHIYRILKTKGYLKPFEVLGGQLLVSLDGTEYFSSKSIHCDQCSHRTHKNGTVTYFHSAILPVIVAPGQKHVISLDPEFITPQDGHEKQDSEVAAAKRWIHRHVDFFDDAKVTLLGDDLYSRQPMCELLINQGFHYIFTCLPESHITLYDWLEYLNANGEISHLTIRKRHGRKWHFYNYRWANNIPLRDAQPALLTNWFELTITCDQQNIFQNAWVCNRCITNDNVIELADSGRARWKTENENHNVLKTKGYHLEHNFGHGKQHLASFLLTLNLLAFLFHTVLHLVDLFYQQIRSLLGTRKRFFNDLRTLTTYFIFNSWRHLISFMLDEFDPICPANSS